MNEFPVSNTRLKTLPACVFVFVLDLGITNPSTVTFSKFSSCLQEHAIAEDAAF